MASRIGFISLHTSPLAAPGRADAGGMNVVVLQSARALARRGILVDLFTRRSDTDTAPITQLCRHLRLITLDAGPPTPLAKSDMEQAIAPFQAQLEAFCATDGASWQLLHSHHWFSGVAGLPVARQLGLPHVQSFHSVAAPKDATTLQAGEPSESPGRIAGEAHVARHSDLVAAVSQVEAATIATRYGVDYANMRVVRPGVGVNFFHPPTGEKHRGDYLLFAARLQPLKGADLALRTLAELRRDFPQLRLILAGAASADFGEYPRELASLACSLGIEDAVEFIGACSREKLAELMRGAQALILPSWSETFGLVALEAQASGTPVIGWRDAGGLAEAIAPGGLLQETRSPKAWAAALGELLRDSSRLAAARSCARTFALQHSWEHVATTLVGMYSELIEVVDDVTNHGC
ncbi:MAG: glycosyltransferase [Bowdeniella nasicola]|nr:glycosyltransferase [Bowdeniella nasicola]